jgi:hypothetical protein
MSPGVALGSEATLSKSYGCCCQLSKSGRAELGVRFRIGLRTVSEEEESSNYNKLWNPVDTVLEKAGAERLRDCKFFLFMDNSTAKGCFY